MVLNDVDLLWWHYFDDGERHRRRQDGAALNRYIAIGDSLRLRHQTANHDLYPAVDGESIL